MDLNDLYNIYRTNIKMEEIPITENLNPIKSGDILVAMYRDKEIRGEVAAVFESYYVLKGKNGSTVKVTLDDVTEHYPKNNAFTSTTKKIVESNIPVSRQTQPVSQTQKQPITTQSSPQMSIPTTKKEESPEVKKKKILEDSEKDQMRNNPDNNIDIMSENIKSIGKVLYYKNYKYKDIVNLFEKKLLNKDSYIYLLTEKTNEIHIVRNNDKGFQIQPFANALVGHFLKSQDRLIKESYGQIKVAGNDNFSIISNIPDKVYKQLLNSFLGLLSGIKK